MDTISMEQAVPTTEKPVVEVETTTNLANSKGFITCECNCSDEYEAEKVEDSDDQDNEGSGGIGQVLGGIGLALIGRAIFG